MRSHKKTSRPVGLWVNVENGNLEKALKIFKQKVKESNLLPILQERSRYEKPSTKRRRKRLQQKLRAKYRNMEQKAGYKS